MVLVALYARVSTDLQEREQTIRSQLDALRRHAQQKGYQIVAEYTDEGYSGATLERPGLDRLRTDAHAPTFELLLCPSPDRLARKSVYLGLVLEEFRRHGLRIEFLNHLVDDTPEGQLLLGIQGLFAEYERAKLLERYRRGRLYWARQGAILTHMVPYGYQFVARDRRRNTRSTLDIDESKAQVVRNIYRWLVVEALSCYQIARRLNALAVPSPRVAARWGMPTVTYILKNEAYKGTFYFRRFHVTTQAPAQEPHPEIIGRRIRRKRPQDDWIIIPVPPIVDVATWEAAQVRIRLNQLEYRHNWKHRRSYLLTGLIRCGQCGATFRGRSVQGRLYYECNRRHPVTYYGDKACHAPKVRLELLEGVIVNLVDEAIQNCDRLIAACQESLVHTRPLADDADEILRIQGSLKRNREHLRWLAQTYESSGTGEDQWHRSQKQLLNERHKLVSDRAEARRRIRRHQLLTKALAQLVTLQESRHRSLWELEFGELREIVQLLVDRVVVADKVVHVETTIPLGTDSRLVFSIDWPPQCLPVFRHQGSGDDSVHSTGPQHNEGRPSLLDSGTADDEHLGRGFTDLTDAQWAVLAPLIPPKARTRPSRSNERMMLNGILWVLCTGARWDDMPLHYGSSSTCRMRLRAWRAAGVWDRIWRALVMGIDSDAPLPWETPVSPKHLFLRAGVLPHRARRAIVAPSGSVGLS